MIVMGIDPGIATTGWSIIENHKTQKLIQYGCILTSKKLSQSERLVQIFDQLNCLIKKYQPQVLSLEKIFFNTNAKTAFNIGEARGVIKICAFLNKIELSEFTPLQIKSTITGYGRADKNQIQAMIKTLLKLEEIPRPDDSADACAVALTYCFYNSKLDKLRR